MNVSNLAFYIAKSSNKNVTIYSFNIVDTTSGNKTIDLFNPLKTYWIMREKDGAPVEELTYMEKTMAYGYDIVEISSDHVDDPAHPSNIDMVGLDSTQLNTIIPIRIKALPNDPIWLVQINNRYQCVINIPNPQDKTKKISVFLKKVFCNVSGLLNNQLDNLEIIYEDPREPRKLKTYKRHENISLDTN